MDMYNEQIECSGLKLDTQKKNGVKKYIINENVVMRNNNRGTHPMDSGMKKIPTNLFILIPKIFDGTNWSIWTISILS